METKTVLCIGEVLWDALPKGIYLGGAPLNVAINLKNLGVDSGIISAVGNDQLGRLALKYIERNSINTNLIQNNNYDTGLVEVNIDAGGIPDYTIHENTAWDHIEATKSSINAIKNADYIVLGSLIFRDKSGDTLRELLHDVTGEQKIIIDVNFRKSYYNLELIDELLKLASIVKLNDEELEEIQKWYGLQPDYHKTLEFLKKEFNLEAVLLTRGDKGSTMLTQEGFTERNCFLIKVKDTVGAGDAFLAGAIYSFINNKNPDFTISFANAMGAFVASRNGATPELNLERVKEHFNYIN
jgi:fructokinase